MKNVNKLLVGLLFLSNIIIAGPGKNAAEVYFRSEANAKKTTLHERLFEQILRYQSQLQPREVVNLATQTDSKEVIILGGLMKGNHQLSNGGVDFSKVSQVK